MSEDSNIYTACLKGQRDLARKLILEGADLNMSSGGFPALYTACQDGHTEIVKMMLERGADANAVNTIDGCPCLYVVAQKGYMEIAKLLLRHGANPNLPNHRGSTSIHKACTERRADMMELLLQNGADGNALSAGFPPLYLAVQEGCIKIVELLLKYGVDINAANTVDGCTSLYVAAQDERLDILCLLLKNNADPNKANYNGSYPLHRACQKHRLLSVELLLSHGADPNIRSRGGFPSLYTASLDGDAEMVALLLKHGADPSLWNTVDSSDPLYAAVQNAHQEIFDMLISHGADLNHVNEKGYTSVHRTCHKGRFEMLTRLLALGADSSVSTSEGKSGLDLCLESGHTEMASLFFRERRLPFLFALIGYGFRHNQLVPPPSPYSSTYEPKRVSAKSDSETSSSSDLGFSEPSVALLLHDGVLHLLPLFNEFLMEDIIKYI